MLYRAAQIGDRRICELLVDHGADVNKGDSRKQTPLWVAAEEGQIDICEVLIQNGASVDKEDATKRIPLFVAARKKHMDVCKILLDNGARLYKKDKFGIGVEKILDDDSLMFKRIMCWYCEYSKKFNLCTLFPN